MATPKLSRLLYPAKTITPFPSSLLRAASLSFQRLYRRSSSSSDDGVNRKSVINTKVNFSLSDSDDDDISATAAAATVRDNKPSPPPPYDPFNTKPAIKDPDDPKNLQEIFHKMRTEGLTNNAIKMFDALSKDGRTHEALQLFGQIKDKGHMPDVVAHTAVVEAYADTGQGKEALKVFLRMLACGVAPNAYTYSVLIRGLAGDAGKYLMEMMGQGMRPNAATYTAVFEGFVREEKMDEARDLLEQMKAKGFVPDEKAVRETLSLSKRGPMFRSLMNILFGK